MSIEISKKRKEGRKNKPLKPHETPNPQPTPKPDSEDLKVRTSQLQGIRNSMAERNQALASKLRGYKNRHQLP